MKNKLIVFSFLFFYCTFSIKAQKDTIMPLHGNAVLMNYNHKHANKKNSQRITSVLPSTVLPFYDDFSYFTSYPDPTKWDSSQSVFVNHTYPIAPPTIGVATFDGLNRNGYPYNIAATSGSILSDSLISMPIRLDSLGFIGITPADSVYLSFYYQAKGRGDSPEYNDDLELFFRDSTTQVWTEVWSINNPAFPLPTDTGFHRVMFPIYQINTDSSHFTSQFQFMFRNRGSQCGAIDHWHLDLIYLNKGRSYIDTIIEDLSFVYDEKSLLKNYMQMPYNQFSGPNDMGDSVHAVLRSNGPIVNMGIVKTGYKILDHTGAVMQQNSVGSNNINPFWAGGYCNVYNLVNAPLNGFTYNGGAFPSPTSFSYEYYCDKNHGQDSIQRNDTAHFNQTFSNFYSYDDGTAEAGYGLNLPSGFANGEIVLKFKLNYADTLRALDIFFDPVIGVNFLENSNIRLLVFGDNAGVPGNTIFIDSLCYPFPLYGDNGYNYFQRYQLSKAVKLDSNQTFYVGVYELLNLPLGIGFDRNNDTRTNIFYNYTDQGGNWVGWTSPSTQDPDLFGSLMIHPVFGDSLSTLNVKSFAVQKNNIGVYPNPASNEIFIQSNNTLTKIIITDLLGNTLMQEQITTDVQTQKINVSTLPNGLYLITTINNKGQSSTQKLIISH